MDVLQYELEQGPVEKLILQQSMKHGKVPQKIADAPVLRMGLELYYAGFLDLVCVRTGFGDGPIPYTAIMDYSRASGLDEEQADDLVYYITQLDSAYMDHIKKKTPKGKGK